MTGRLLVIAALVAVLAPPAHAESIVVASGQTLSRIAKKTGCTVKQLKRANALHDDAIYPGQKLQVPECVAKDASDDDAHATKSSKKKRKKKNLEELAAYYDLAPAGKVKTKKGQSIGAPWDGKLENGVQLPKGRGYFIRHPERAWGTTHEVAQIQRAIKAVRKRFPRVHTLAIGDLSAKHGGDVSSHHSHESGRDVDVGFYFKKKPAGYPESFVGYQSAELDMAATWALLYAFARTADQPNGVQQIFLDFKLQGKIYTWAKDHGVPVKYLDKLFQWPTEGGDGIVKHEPDHDNHLHVRFKCPEKDSGCQR